MLNKSNKDLFRFIREARERGYSDLQIRNILLEQNWSVKEIEKAFLQLQPKFKLKNQVCVFLDNEILKILEKRAKRNMFTLSEQIEDIIRRSCIMARGQRYKKPAKLDDILISVFSREKRGRKRK